MSLWMRLAIALGVLILMAGCGLLPEIAHQPTYHNPFPQITKVAVAPFFNTSTEPTVDGRQFAEAYFHELQAIPGFEVVPVGIVEQKAQELGLSLAHPVEVRKLAQALEVDAVVVGAVTEFSPYYPPRCAMQVEWYAANPCFHPIPIGYGLPWGTPEEEYIPDTLVLETELGLAREQLKTQTPQAEVDVTIPVDFRGRPKAGNLMAILAGRDRKSTAPDESPHDANNRLANQPKQYPVRQIDHQRMAAGTEIDDAERGGWRAAKGSAQRPQQSESKLADRTPATPSGNSARLGANRLQVVAGTSEPRVADKSPGERLSSVLSIKSRAALATQESRPGGDDSVDQAVAQIDEPQGAVPVEEIAPGRLPSYPASPLAMGANAAVLPPNWPDPKGLVPPPPSAVCPDCQPTYEPVLRHTRAYSGNDVRFTTALESYAYFRDDARATGWKSYLQRSDDFIRFCCHMHITEMLTARGGAGETRVVWRWPDGR
jgi:hypothetical protein